MIEYEKKKILIVDDLLPVRSLIRGLLSKIGLKNVDDVSDGTSAFKLLKNGCYDIVLTDWDMPKMSGIELLKKMKNEVNLKNIPVIIVTGKAINREEIVMAVQSGARDYILKPFTQLIFEQKLKKILFS